MENNILAQLSHMSDLDSIIDFIISDAAPGELSQVKENLSILLSGSQSGNLISKALEKVVLSKDYELIKLPYAESYYILSHHSKVTKFVDFENGKVFNYDFENRKVIDVESAETELPDFFHDLNEKLQLYTSDHFPSQVKAVLIPKEDEVVIVILDLKLNDSNYYNGKWQSTYTFNLAEQQLKGQVNVKVHYYEDGNVFFKTSSNLDKKCEFSDIISTIKDFENDFEISILTKFQSLNEKCFKTLRRQLPINRSKIHWGKAIRNYKLGQDVTK